MDAIIYARPIKKELENPLVDALKNKITKEFTYFINKLKKGNALNYQFILEEILFLELIKKDALNNDSNVLQYYLNNKWII